MDKKDDPTKFSPNQLIISSKFMSVGLRVGAVTLVIVFASVFGGLWLDNLFKTKPLITVLLVLASAPLSLVITFRIARRAVADLTAPPPEEKTTNLSKNEGEPD